MLIIRRKHPLAGRFCCLGLFILLLGVAWPVQAQHNRALYFDGDGDYVDMGYLELSFGHPTDDLDITMDTWVNLSSYPTGFARIAGVDNGGNQFQFRMNGSTLEFVMGAEDIGVQVVQAPTALNLNQWYHLWVAVNQDDGADFTYIDFYVNGEVVAHRSLRYSNFCCDFDVDPHINGVFRAGEGLHGFVDEVRIFHHNLINERLYMPYSNFINEPVHQWYYWRFNESSGTTALPTRNTRNGTVVTTNNPTPWVLSDAPADAAEGHARFLASNETASFDMGNTGVFANVTNGAVAGNLLAYRFNLSPFNAPTGIEEIYNDQFWVIARDNPSVTFTTNLTFTLGEAIDGYGASLFKLYHRSSNASGTGGWAEIATATAVNAAQRTVTFNAITTPGEFIVARVQSGSSTPANSAVTALDFDGADDSVSLGTLSLSGSALTLQAWAQPDAVNGTRSVVHLGNSANLSIENGKAVFRILAGGILHTVTGALNLTAGNWYHLAGTYDGTTARVFVGGVEDGSQAASGTYSLLENTFIGAGGGHFDGRIDEAAIWTVARTDQEILGSFPSTLVGNESGLTYYYQFNEGVNTTTTDTQRGRIAHLVNMAVPAAWGTSDIPALSALVNVQTPGTGDAAPVVFGTTGVTIDFTANDQADPISSSLISNAPGTLPANVEEIYDNQYWVVRRASGRTFSADVTFVVTDDLGSYASNFFKLYRRGADEGSGIWTEVATASAVNHGTKTLTFPGITQFGQFVIGRAAPAAGTPSTLAGTALDFNGTNSQVDLRSTSIRGTAFSVEAWIRPDVFATNQSLVRIGSGADLRLANGQLAFDVSIDGTLQTVTGTTTLLAGIWHHVAATYDGTTVRIYINGVEDGATNAPGTFTAAGAFALGTGSGFYDGLLEEVRLWTATRSIAQLRETMHRTLIGNESGLRYYFQFNEGSGGTLTDAISGRFGTLQNINTTTGWVTSTVALPSAVTSTASPGIGAQAFGATGVSLNLITNPQAEPILVDRFTAALGSVPANVEELYDDQYWSIRRLGTGTFTTDITFTLAENLGSYAANLFELYRQDASGAWVSVGTASGVIGNDVTFSGLTAFGTFVVTRRSAASTPPNTTAAGSLLAFDGTDDVVDLRTVVLQGNNLTVETTLRADNVSTGTLLSIGGSLLSIDLTGGNARFSLNVGGTLHHVTSSTSLTAGLHYHVAGTYDGSQVRIYVNGQEVGSTSASGTLNLVGTLQFGNGGSAYDGRLEEVRIWTVTRSATEINTSRSFALQGNENGLRYYFQLNEGSGTTITDAQRGRFGTLVNMDTGTAWEVSTWPLAAATSAQTEAPGTILFGTTGVTAQYLSQSGANVTVTRIAAAPTALPTGVDEVLQNQYWIFERTGSGLFNVSLTFTPGETLSAADASVPARLKLFRRDNENSTWALEAVGARVNTVDNTVTFDGIRRFSEFIIARGDVITASTVSATDDTFEDRVLLTWTAPAAGGGNIRVTRQEGANAAVVLSLLGGDATSYIDATGNPGVTYTYCIELQATNGTVIDTACDTGQRIIFAPTSVAAADGTFEDKGQVTWSDRSTVETGYNVYRDAVLLQTVAANTGTYDDANAVSGTTYNYCVTAFLDANSNGTFDAGTDFESAQVCDNGQRGHVLPPKNMTATTGTYANKVIITWTDQTNSETGYQVTRTFNNTTETVQANTGVIANGETSIEDLTAVAGQLYRYCVTTLSASGNSVAICDFGGVGVLPTAVSVAASDNTFDDKVRVSWSDTSATETGFRVYRETISTSFDTLLTTTASNRSRYDDTSASPNVAYRYCVQAITNVSGSVVEATRQCNNGQRTYALAPTAVAATDSTHEDRVVVTWTNAATTAVFMRIYRAGTQVRTVQASVTSFTDREVASNQRFNYCVEAVTSDGQVSGQTCDFGSRSLAAPTDVAAEVDANESSVEVTWLDNSSVEAGYNVYRKVVGASDSTRIGATGPSVATFTDRTGQSGVTYTYSVNAFDLHGASPSGRDDGRRTIAVPTALAVSNGLYEDRIELTWADNSRVESGYYIYRRLTSASDSTRIDTTAARATSYTDTNALTFGASYTYSITAFDAHSESVPATGVGATAVTSPADASASDTYTDKVVVTWVDQSTIETGYQVYRDGVAIGGVLAANASTYVDNSAVAGTQYTYCVAAVSGAASSSQVCDKGTRQSTASNHVLGEATANSTLPQPTDGYTSKHAVVSRNGRYALAIANTNNSNFHYSSRLYHLQDDGSWQQQAEFTNSLEDGRAHYVSLSKNGDLAAITYPEGQDRIYIYEREGSTWREQDVINDITAEADYRAVLNDEGTTLAVVDGSNAAYVYNRAGTQWSQTIRLLNVGGNFDRVDIDGAGETVVIGRSVGGVWVYRLINGQWVAETGIDQSLGADVAIDPSGEYIIAGRSTTAFVYKRVDGVWRQMQELSHPTGASHAHYGTVVDMAFGNIVIADNTDKKVYLFQLNDDVWSSTQNIVAGISRASSLGQSLELGIGSILMTAEDGNSNRFLYRFDLLAAPGDVAATDGTQESTVQITWKDLTDFEENFRIYRDGELIATTGANIRSFTDSEVSPGHLAYYCVTSFNETMEPQESGQICDWGYMPPDGFIAGRIASAAGAGVDNVDVCLAPSPNRALLFDGNGGHVTVQDVSLFDFSGNQDFTLEAWVKYGAASGTDAVVLAKRDGGSVFPFELRTSSTQAGQLVCERSDGTNTAQVSTTATNLNDDAWHHVACVHDGTGKSLTMYVDGQAAGNATYTVLNNTANTSDLYLGRRGASTNQWFGGLIDEVRIWNTTRTTNEIATQRTQVFTGEETGLIGFWALDEFAGGATTDLTDAFNHGLLKGGAFRSEQAAPLSTCAQTDANGNYTFSNLRYNESTTFKLTPSKADRAFDPSAKSLTLSLENPVQNEVGFTDVSSYTIAGRVLFNGTECPVQDVQMFLGPSGENGNVKGRTEPDGTYAISADPGNWLLRPAFGEGDGIHTFSPTSQTLNITTDVANINFTNQSTVKLTGFAGGDCQLAVGQIKARIYTENGCYDQEVTLNGAYSLTLPPQEYFVQVVDVVPVDGINKADVLAFFDRLGPQRVNLSGGDAELELLYRAPLKVSFNGLTTTDATCSAANQLNLPILTKGSVLPLTISVNQDYGNAGLCPIDEASLALVDLISNNAETLTVNDGVANYTLTVGEPNVLQGLVIAGVDRSYQKSIEATVEVTGLDPITQTDWVVVEGTKARIGTFTSAVTDPIPMMVVHDPPGDGSYAYIEKGTTVCHSISRAAVVDAGFGSSLELELGVNTLAGTAFGALLGTEFGGGVVFEGRTVVGVEGTRLNECSVGSVFTNIGETLALSGGSAALMGPLAIPLIAGNVVLATSQGDVCGPSFEVCVTAEETISTGDLETTIGPDSDIIVGTALNFLFALADKVDVNNSCEIDVTETLGMDLDPNGAFETTFMYPQHHIKNVLLPQHEQLIGLTANEEAKQRLEDSRTNLHQMVSDNARRITAAIEKEDDTDAYRKRENRSFAAGAPYEYSVEKDSTAVTYLQSTRLYLTSENNVGAKFTLAKNDQKALIALDVNREFSKEEEINENTTTTVGYVLDDDDIGDYYTVEVGWDAVYGTPVFELVSGATSNPWETWVPLDCLGTAGWNTPGSSARTTDSWNDNCEVKTQPHDRPTLSVSPSTRINVDPADKASYTVALGNTSDSGSAREYRLRALNEFNPDGATIRVNGTPLQEVLTYFVPSGQNQNITLTVERGPNKFQYDSLAIVTYPPAELDIWGDGGVNGNGIVQQSDTAYFSVSYNAPCSDISVLRPLEHWRYTSANTNPLEVILNEFSLTFGDGQDVQAVGLEYRRAGESTWLEAFRQAASGLSAGTTSLTNQTWTPPQDGTYEVRAFSECQGTGKLYSTPVVGTVDTAPPVVFTTPQPADQVLTLGEDVAISFDEAVLCSTVDTDGANNNDTVQLFYADGAEDGQTIPVTALCKDETITLAPQSGWTSAFEGRLLRARVNGLTDPSGNALAAAREWTFTVARNTIAFNPANKHVVLSYGQSQTVSVELVNGSSQQASFAIPANLTLQQTHDGAGQAINNGPTTDIATRDAAGTALSTGSVVANGTQGVSFTLPSTLALGRYAGSFTVTTTPDLGAVPFHFTTEVVCQAPTWSVTPADFQYSMTVTAQLFMRQSDNSYAASTDTGDRIAAFVDGELRGVASVADLGGGLFRANLIVYSNAGTDEKVEFRAYDASTCNLHAETSKVFVFQSDVNHGTPNQPITIQAPAPPAQNIALAAGWTWISTNKVPAANDVTNVLKTLGGVEGTAGDIIKSQTAFSLYDAGTETWIGTLSSLAPGAAYQVKLAQSGEFQLQGPDADLTSAISVQQGWNWIGYTPQAAQGIDAALANLSTAETNDLIKSQFAFAQYVAGVGWLGSLSELEPGYGYLLRAGQAGSFAYAAPAGAASSPLVRVEEEVSALAVAQRSSTPVADAEEDDLSGKYISPARAERREHLEEELLQVQARRYAHSMAVIATLEEALLPVAGEAVQVGAYIGGELRGRGELVYVEALEAYRAFVLVHSDGDGEEVIGFRRLDGTGEVVEDLSQEIRFAIDGVAGSVDEPLMLQSRSGVGTEVPATYALEGNYPNPFNPTTVIRYSVPEATAVEIEVYDVMGRHVVTLLKAEQEAGRYEVVFDGEALASGVYVYRMRAGTFVQAHRMVLVK